MKCRPTIFFVVSKVWLDLDLSIGFIHGFAPVQEFQNYTVARDSFLAHLGATLWGSMRHIVSPSVVDGAFHYYEKISFQLFFMTQEVGCVFDHLKRLPTKRI